MAKNTWFTSAKMFKKQIFILINMCQKTHQHEYIIFHCYYNQLLFHACKTVDYSLVTINQLKLFLLVQLH